MPLELKLPPDTRSIELDEYINILEEKNYDLTCQDDIISSARYLKQLNNTKSFLINYLCDELKDIDRFQKSNYYGPQVFIIHTAEKYFIRAVVWNTVSQTELAIKNYKYDICHDHNFDILTIGYFGPGYESRCYTYENNNVTGILGEQINMTNEEIITLNEGTVLLYRAKKDIHIQLPPAGLSISLKIMPRSSKKNEPQFQFDETKKQLCKYIQLSGSELIVRLAGIYGNERYLELLDSIFKKTPNPHLKAHAAISMIKISPALKSKVEKFINTANQPLVSDLFMKENLNYGASLDMFTT